MRLLRWLTSAPDVTRFDCYVCLPIVVLSLERAIWLQIATIIVLVLVSKALDAFRRSLE